MQDVWTDGACSRNGQKGAKAGWAAWFGEDDLRNTSGSLGGRKQSNNRAELTGILEALKVTSPLRVNTDSEYCIKVITGVWNGRRNKDLIDQIQAIMGDSEFVKVDAHTRLDDGNDHADKMAVKAILFLRKAD